MRLVLVNSLLLVGVAISLVGCSGKDGQPQAAANQPKQSDYQKKMTVDMQINQINGSNLSPEDKQRMIDQVRASGGH